jgi:hypothetical protein
MPLDRASQQHRRRAIPSPSAILVVPSLRVVRTNDGSPGVSSLGGRSSVSIPMAPRLQRWVLGTTQGIHRSNPQSRLGRANGGREESGESLQCDSYYSCGWCRRQWRVVRSDVRPTDGMIASCRRVGTVSRTRFLPAHSVNVTRPLVTGGTCRECRVTATVSSWDDFVCSASQ